MKRTLFSQELLLLFLLTLLFTACKEDYEEPEIPLDTYQVEEGFELEVVVSEPFLEAPVAIDFDNQGRIWAVEMRGYMQTLTGESETMPNGVISIQEDLDKDGVVDHSKVFLEGLVLPRAIALVYDGLLYAEPPNLWFVEIENDKPGKKVLVDSLYAAEGNVEHMPNGLMMNIDNWIYNARSHFRYQRKNGQWIKEPTSFRGQWGITKDNFGRLYYNNNSTQIMGDYALPNVLINNPYYTPREGISKVLTSNQRVYPLQATAVNRGYQQGVLDSDSMLVNVTSSCGPVIYRGGIFPDEFDQNAFVSVPEVNAVKRNFLSFEGPVVKATQAYDDREFIASTDEGFRPVNLFNGPDGGMYIVDMHRGIIQHGAYMTSYLREKLAERGLDKIIGMGRVLRVKHKSQALTEIPDFESLTASQLVALLDSENGWVRDHAQQFLILRQPDGAGEALNQLLTSNASSIAKAHAVYALEGMNKLSRKNLVDLASNSDPRLVAHVLRLLAVSNEEASVNEELGLLNQLTAKNDPNINFYLKAFTGDWIRRYGSSADELIKKIMNQPMSALEEEAVISGLAGSEESLQALTPLSEGLQARLDEALGNRKKDEKHWIFEQASVEMDNRTHGLQLYRNTCAACHGGGGRGIEGLAPPLDGSDYITGSVKRLGLVLLHGLKGPIHVNGKEYSFNSQMPGLSQNPTMTDQDIADLMIYLSNAFGESSWAANAEMVKELRDIKPQNGAFTEPELNKITDQQ